MPSIPTEVLVFSAAIDQRNTGASSYKHHRINMLMNYYIRLEVFYTPMLRDQVLEIENLDDAADFIRNNPAFAVTLNDFNGLPVAVIVNSMKFLSQKAVQSIINGWGIATDLVFC